jgi:hypothetical protein
MCRLYWDSYAPAAVISANDQVQAPAAPPVPEHYVLVFKDFDHLSS